MNKIKESNKYWLFIKKSSSFYDLDILYAPNMYAPKAALNTDMK